MLRQKKQNQKEFDNITSPLSPAAYAASLMKRDRVFGGREVDRVAYLSLKVKILGCRYTCNFIYFVLTL
jgi:hypothetical protein